MESKAIIIRYKERFLHDVIVLIDRTIRASCFREYSDKELDAWSPLLHPARTREKLSASIAHIALINSHVIGISSCNLRLFGAGISLTMEHA